MSELHRHMIPRKNNFQIRIVEPHHGRPTHVTYGIWVGIFLILMLPSRKGAKKQEIRTDDATKGYSLLLRSLGML